MLEQLAKHGGFALAAHLQGRSADRRASHGRGLRARAWRGPAAGARLQGRHRPLRLSVADGRGGGAGGASTFPGAPSRSSPGASTARQSAVCRRSWCRTSFARSAESLGAAMHVSVTGENSHHMIEACFKGVGRALRQALRREGHELPSTKGVSVTDAVIIDSGGANLASLQFALERLGARAVVSSDAPAIAAAPRVLLPGVGVGGGCHATAAPLRPGGTAADAAPAGARHLPRDAAALRALGRRNDRVPGYPSGDACAGSRRRAGGRCRTWDGTNSQTHARTRCSRGSSRASMSISCTATPC